MAKFATCYDITPNRCTVLEVFPNREDAEAACYDQDEIKVFEIDPAATGSWRVKPALRAFHANGKVWA